MNDLEAEFYDNRPARAVIVRNPTRVFGRYDIWVTDGMIRYCSDIGIHAMSRRRAEYKARKLLARYHRINAPRARWEITE